MTDAATVAKEVSARWEKVAPRARRRPPITTNATRRARRLQALVSRGSQVDLCVLKRNASGVLSEPPSATASGHAFPGSGHAAQIALVCAPHDPLGGAGGAIRKTGAQFKGYVRKT